MKNDLTVDCTIFPLETVRIYVETIMGISKKPISLEILLDLIRFLLDFGKAERGRNYWYYFPPVLVQDMAYSYVGVLIGEFQRFLKLISTFWNI